jgi:restriction system protein
MGNIIWRDDDDRGERREQHDDGLYLGSLSEIYGRRRGDTVAYYLAGSLSRSHFLTTDEALRYQQIASDLNLPEGIIINATIVRFGDRTNDGRLVQAVSLPWFQIVNNIKNDPEFLYHFSRHPEKFEELIAAAYDRAGWPQVELTPRSNDRGRDVIATNPGFGAVRFLEQTKAYSPGRLVTHKDVREMLGVLSLDSNASKAIITTTSDFQPGIMKEPDFWRFIPYRLELKNGPGLRDWLVRIAMKDPSVMAAGKGSVEGMPPREREK